MTALGAAAGHAGGEQRLQRRGSLTQGWFMMQIGMMLGFACSYPINTFLVNSGWKEEMPPTADDLKHRIAKQQVKAERDRAA